jgi:hypothetical protein
LEQVLGIGQRAKNAVAVHLQLVAVRLDELAERVPVAFPGTGKQLRGHEPILASTSS